MRKTRVKAVEPEPAGSSKGNLKENEKKWGKPLIAAGWTLVPSSLIRGQRALGLTPMDLSILLQLFTYWWTKDKPPYVGKRTIAGAIGVDERHVRRRLKALQEVGYITVKRRKGALGGDATSAFTFDGLIAAATKLAEDQLEYIAERRERRTRRLTKRRHLRSVK